MNVDVYFDIETDPPMNGAKMAGLLSLTNNFLTPVGIVQAGRRLWRVNIEAEKIAGIQTELEAAGYTPEILAVCEITVSGLNIRHDYPVNKDKYQSYFQPYIVEIDGLNVDITPPQNSTLGYDPPIW